MSDQLSVIVAESGLETTKAKIILENFQDYFDIAAEWEARAKTIKVTNASQVTDMKIARTGRLFLREKRIAIENTRKQLKEQALREGKAIDGIANVLKGLIVPIENYLDEQEHFVEIQEQKRIEAERIEAERKAEEERKAREKAEAEERERIRIENERLKKEAEAREAAIAREKAAAEAREIRLKKEAEEREAMLKKRADDERRQIEEKFAVERKMERKELNKKIQEIECPKCHHKFSLSL